MEHQHATRAEERVCEAQAEEHANECTIEKPCQQCIAEGLAKPDGTLPVSNLEAWNNKIAELLNHGLNDAEVPDYFTPEQARNFIRDYTAAYRNGDTIREAAKAVLENLNYREGANMPEEWHRLAALCTADR